MLWSTVQPSGKRLRLGTARWRAAQLPIGALRIDFCRLTTGEAKGELGSGGGTSCSHQMLHSVHLQCIQ